MTNCTHHTNKNTETLKGTCSAGCGASGASSSNSAATSSGTNASHGAHMSKSGKPIEEDVLEVKEEWDY